jgi:hypothetical protein
MLRQIAEYHVPFSRGSIFAGRWLQGHVQYLGWIALRRDVPSVAGIPRQNRKPGESGA